MDKLEDQECDSLVACRESRSYCFSEVALMITHVRALLSLLEMLDNCTHNLGVTASCGNGESVPKYR